MADKLIELAVEIQQIPAPTFSEGLRADFVKAKFVEEGKPIHKIIARFKEKQDG